MNYAVSAVEGLSPNTRSGEVDLVVHDPGNRPFCWIENMYFVPRLGGMSGWQGTVCLSEVLDHFPSYRKMGDGPYPDKSSAKL